MKYKFNLKIDTTDKFSKKRVRTPDINRRSNNNSPNVKKHRISVEKISDTQKKRYYRK
tara:strand:- start:193 stop:366 length:174 start_codon:yes stop_codon:yes gene_type:complete